MPYMTLGMAASRSTAYPRIIPTFFGASTIKRDAANARGKAINRAITVVTDVPTIDGNAPNFSLAGSQSLETSNSKPNLLHASLLAHRSCMKKPAVRIKTAAPQARHMALKQLSVFIVDIFTSTYSKPSRRSAITVDLESFRIRFPFLSKPKSVLQSTS